MMRRNGLTHGRTLKDTRHRRNGTDRYGRMRRNETTRSRSRESTRLRMAMEDAIADHIRGV